MDIPGVSSAFNNSVIIDVLTFLPMFVYVGAAAGGGEQGKQYDRAAAGEEQHSTGRTCSSRTQPQGMYSIIVLKIKLLN